MTGKVETDCHSGKLTYVFNFIEILGKYGTKKGNLPGRVKRGICLFLEDISNTLFSEKGAEWGMAVILKWREKRKISCKSTEFTK